MRNEIPEGYELIVGHSADNARKALQSAEDRGLEPQTVIRSRSGYLVPLESVPEVVEPFANVEEFQAARAADEELETVEKQELVIPKNSHAAIDEFAQEWEITYDGIEAKDAEKPTVAEKVAHVTKAIDAKAAENDKNEGE
jgi:hypothetical protein